MYIQNLYLTQFRNYSDVHFTLTPGINIIYGSNGHGKTNLLEALYAVTQGHSFRTSKSVECVAWDTPFCVVRAEGEAHSRAHTQSFKLTNGNKKQVKVNNQEYTQLSKLIGTFCVVPIVSNDIEIVQGAPAHRRKYVDSVISQHSLPFLQMLKDYNRTLKQRNAFLKSNRSKNPLWETLTHQLCKLGTSIVLERKAFIDDISPYCCDYYRTISSAAEELSLKYHSTVGSDFDQTTFYETYFSKLSEKSVVEFELGSTLYGPHKDDLTLWLNNHEARSFGSQGQCRSIALALRLAAAKKIEDSVGEPPILLLDDIFAELDNTRRRAIGTLISRHSQVLVATPHQEDLPFESNNIIKIVQGEIVQ